MEELEANVPQPGSERGAWVLAGALGIIGVAVLALVLSGVVGGASSRMGAAPPPVIAVTPTPSPAVVAQTGSVIDVSGTAASFDELQARLEEQRNKVTRVRVPTWEEVERGLPPGFTTPNRVVWNLVDRKAHV